MGERLNLLSEYLRFNFKAALEYRAAFLMEVFGMVLNNASFILFWHILFLHRQSIGGYAFQQVMFLWALVALGFGISTVFMGNVLHVGRIIFNGELDVYLLQPRNVPINLLSSRMNVSGWGDVLFGLALYFFTQSLSLRGFLLFFYCSLLSAVLMTAANLVYQSLTFFMGKADDIGHLGMNGMLTFSTYPGTLFKGWVKMLLLSLIPAGWIAYIPVELSVNFSWIRLGLLTLVDGGFVLLSLGVFYLGLRRYESGNRMGTRL